MTLRHPFEWLLVSEQTRALLVVLILMILVGAGLPLLGVNAAIGDALEDINPVFWLEAISVVVFGISWLVKGQALLRDPR